MMGIAHLLHCQYLTRELSGLSRRLGMTEGNIYLVESDGQARLADTKRRNALRDPEGLRRGLVGLALDEGEAARLRATLG